MIQFEICKALRNVEPPENAERDSIGQLDELGSLAMQLTRIVVLPYYYARSEERDWLH